MLFKYEDKYSEEAKVLLKENRYTIVIGEKAEETIVSTTNNKITGIGSLWHNNLHPNREYLGIYVSPAYRDKGLGTKIYNELYEFSKTKRLQTSIESTDETARSFLNKKGFGLARKCYTPILKYSIFNIENNYIDELTLFKELTPEQQKELIVLQLTNYRKCHEPINALSETITADNWSEIIMDGLDVDYSFVLLKDSKVEAYLLSYEGENDKEIEIGYIGGRNPLLIPDYLSFYKKALSKLIKEFNEVSIEADDVDPFATSVLNLFEYDKHISWDAYLLN